MSPFIAVLRDVVRTECRNAQTGTYWFTPHDDRTWNIKKSCAFSRSRQNTRKSCFALRTFTWCTVFASFSLPVSEIRARFLCGWLQLCWRIWTYCGLSWKRTQITLLKSNLSTWKNIERKNIVLDHLQRGLLMFLAMMQWDLTLQVRAACSSNLPWHFNSLQVAYW